MIGSGKVALVAANGTLPSPEILASLLSFHPFILAADGGANNLLSRGIVANAVIGDFDSASDHLPPSIQRIPAPDQNFTDLDKAVGHLVDHGFNTIWMVGATGDRLDHTVASLSILIKYSGMAQIALVDDYATACKVDGTLMIETEVGQKVSLLALGEVRGISTTGLQWNLDNAVFAPGVRDGISNVAIEEEVTITASSGPLIVYAFHE